MDDLHQDSSDTKSVKIRTDDTTETAETAETTNTTTVKDATTPPVADEPTETPANEAMSKDDKDNTAPVNGASPQVEHEAIAANEANGVSANNDASADSAEAVAAVNEGAEAAEATEAAAPAETAATAATSDIADVAAPAEPSADMDADTEEMPVAPAPDLSASAEKAAAFATIRELGRDGWGRILLAWHGDTQAEDDQEQPPVGLLERAELDVEAAQRIVAFHLYHGRLLSPRAIITREGEGYWLAFEAPQPYESPFTSISDGGRVDPKGALKAGVGLANALSYLHTNGVAHKHVGPGAILVHGNRAYLSGVERAALVETTETSSADLFTADVNALARTLVMLAGLPDTPPADETGHAQVLRAIAARADAAGFVTAEDLAQECGQALQDPVPTLPVPDTTAMRPLVFQCGTATTVGLLRSQNQDALGCSVLDIRDDVGGSSPLGIFLVADGMGGEAAGEIASRIGARIVMAELVRQLLVPALALPALEPLSPEKVSGAASVTILAQALSIAVDAANRQVRGLASSLQESTGTTLTALVAAEGRVVLAHLGDSRAYLLRNGSLVQLTRDHSLLARLEELDHPLLNDPSFGMPRNYLYRSLGQEDEAPPDMMEFPVAAGDRLMLCSDGLWDELDDETIQRSLTSSDDPTECANHLVRLANAAGGHDNSTAVVVFVVAQPDDPAGEMSREEVDAILRATGVLDDGDDA